jgi:hypothetical protein
MKKRELSWPIVAAALALGCDAPVPCPDSKLNAAGPPATAAEVPPPPPPPAPPQAPPAPPRLDADWIPLPAGLRDDPRYLNGEVCRSLNTTCSGKQTRPCENFGEGWTKFLTRDQVLCIIAAQKIGNGDWRVEREARAEWIRGCGAPVECQ